MPHTDAIIVMTTVASVEEAVTLIRELLDRRLGGIDLPSDARSDDDDFIARTCSGIIGRCDVRLHGRRLRRRRGEKEEDH